MFRDNEILNALDRIQKRLEYLQYEIRSEKIDRQAAQAGWNETVKKILSGYKGIGQHINTGDKMTPQQAAGVPDDVPTSMIGIYQYFHSLSAKDVSDIVDKAPKSGWFIHYGGQVKAFEDLGLKVTGAQAPRRECGCPFALPTHLAGCPIKEKQDAEKLVRSIEDYKKRVRSVLGEIDAEKRACPLCSTKHWCDTHVRTPKYLQAQAKILAQDGGKELIDYLNSQTSETAKKAYDDLNWSISHGRWPLPQTYQGIGVWPCGCPQVPGWPHPVKCQGQSNGK